MPDPIYNKTEPILRLSSSPTNLALRALFEGVDYRLKCEKKAEPFLTLPSPVAMDAIS